MAISVFAAGTVLTEAQRHVVFAAGTPYAGERGIIRHQWTNGVTDVQRLSDGLVYRRTATDLDPYLGVL